MSKSKYPDLVPQLRQERFQMAIIEELVEINKKLEKLTSTTATETIKPVPTTTKKTTTKKRTVKKDNEVK